MPFYVRKVLYLIYIFTFHVVCSWRYNWQLVTIGAANGLVTIRHQAISFIDNDSISGPVHQCMHAHASPGLNGLKNESSLILDILWDEDKLISLLSLYAYSGIFTVDLQWAEYMYFEFSSFITQLTHWPLGDVVTILNVKILSVYRFIIYISKKSIKLSWSLSRSTC